MTKHKASQLRDDIHSPYSPGKEGGRGVAIIKDHIDVSMQRREDYARGTKERLITAANNNIVKISTDKKEKKTAKKKKQKWEENNCMDISHSKLARLYTKRRRYGNKMGILKEKLNPF